MNFGRYIMALTFLTLPLSGVSATDAETVVGHTAGQFQVSETGAATYTIPVSVSPGTAGVEPKLALSYSSQGQNYLLGIGWSLSGLSVISRCPATTAQDGFIDGIEFDDNDRFCLDGERLMAIGGTYGADATEYRTEQNTFRRVISYAEAGSGPASFTIWTKSGLIMEYGATEDSRIEVQGRTSVLFWAVNKISDTSGNFFTVSYFEDNVAGEYRPTRVDYTGNEAASLATYNSVQLLYEDRPDLAERYVSGSVLKTTKRLAQIQAFDGDHIYREYRLAYELSEATEQSRLKSITECGSDGSCFAPTLFIWSQEREANLSPILHNTISNGFGGDYTEITGDFNGDGKIDLGLVHLSSTYGWIAHTTLSVGDGHFGEQITTNISSGFGGVYEKFTGDVNGDGMTDLLLVHFSSTYGWISYSSLSLGDGGFAPPTVTRVTQGFGGAYQKIVGDFDGDGRIDIGLVHISSTYGWIIKIAAGQGDGTFTPFAVSKPVTSLPGDHVISLGDFNGDGRTDVGLVQASNGGIRVIRIAHSEGEGNFSPALPTDLTLQHSSNTVAVPGDFNGDSLTDLAFLNHSPGSDWTIQTALCQGDGSFAPVRLDLIKENLQGTQSPTFGDFNGDGALDAAMVHLSQPDGWIAHVALSSRDGNYLPYQWNGMSPGFGGSYTKITGDFNGDGRTDLGLIHLSSTYGWLGKTALSGTDGETGNQAPSANRITAIVTGHSQTYQLTYKPLTDAIVYTKDSLAEFPNQDTQQAIPVVQRVGVSDGIGGMRFTRYKYGGAKVDLSGRGFRGFERSTITDELTGIKTTTFYDRRFECISSKIRRVEQRQPNGTLITETDNEINVQDHGFGVHFSYIGTSITKRYELDGTIVSRIATTTDYNTSGNVLALNIDYGDGHFDQTVNFYEDDLEAWIIGRLIRTEVTKNSPGQPPQTRTSEFSYDLATGLLLSETLEPDLTDFRLEKTYQHDQFGNVVASSVSGSDFTTRSHSTSYDAEGRYVVTTANALGHSETRTYSLGNQTAITGPNQLTTTWKYDGFGRSIEEIRANGTSSISEFVRCTDSCPPSAIYFLRTLASGSPSTKTYFDLLDREVRSETDGYDARPIYVDTEYDSFGNISRISEPFLADTEQLWSSYNYDLFGRLLTESRPGAGVTRTEYSGRKTKIINALQQQSERETDARGQVIFSSDNLGSRVTYTYDAWGNIVEVQDPLGNVTRISYDQRGNRTSIDDPDSGPANYYYNSLGELTSQTMASGLSITMEYDLLGRLIRRNEPEGSSIWTYDSHSGGVGQIASVERRDFVRKHFYDSLGRPELTVFKIEGESHSYTTTYDLFSRLATLVYPTGFAVKKIYNSQGYESEIRRASDDSLYWKVNAINHRGQVEETTLGNGLTTARIANPRNGRTESLITEGVQHLTFGYDVLGNLQYRSDELRELSETFSYDDLNRLTGSTVGNQEAVTVSYDILGNILTKSDVGTYSYGEGGAGPHAATSITGEGSNTYTYDANGNRLSSSNGTITYTSFNKPSIITQGDTTITFTYGPEYSRFRQEATVGDATTTTLYIGGLLDRETTGTQTRDIHYIRASGQTIALYSLEHSGDASLEATRYLHRDHLASVQTVTDEFGVVTEVLSFGPWGRRRNPENWSPAMTPIFTKLNRGFTGHEHLDEVALIHMNGRVYEPTTGRFLSADPFVQEPEDSQSLNRYSYVLNNPLSLKDPSGLFFKSLFGGLRRAFRGTISFLEDNGYQVVNAIGVATGNPILASTVVSVHSGIQSGAGFGDILRTTISAAAISAVTTEATGFIGSENFQLNASASSYRFAQTIAHGVVQGTSRLASGGRFEHGFLAGAVGKAGILGGNLLGGSLGAAIGGIVAGGTAEEIGGGKFANGALSGAFVYFFNYMSGQSCESRCEYRGFKELRRGWERTGRTGRILADEFSALGLDQVADLLSTARNRRINFLGKLIKSFPIVDRVYDFGHFEEYVVWSNNGWLDRVEVLSTRFVATSRIVETHIVGPGFDLLFHSEPVLLPSGRYLSSSASALPWP